MTSSLLALQPSSISLSQEPKEQLESDKEVNYFGDLILEGIQSKYSKNNRNYDNMDKELQLQERTESANTLPSISSELEDKIDELANRVMSILDQFDRIYKTAKEEDYPIDEIIEDRERLKDFLMI
jgi:K+/H+ antiporter YhaU regulatory subunit KhtT